MERLRRSRSTGIYSESVPPQPSAAGPTRYILFRSPSRIAALLVVPSIRPRNIAALQLFSGHWIKTHVRTKLFPDFSGGRLFFWMPQDKCFCMSSKQRYNMELFTTYDI